MSKFYHSSPKNIGVTAFFWYFGCFWFKTEGGFSPGWAHQCRKHNVRGILLEYLYIESKITMIKWSPERQRDRHVFMMKAKTGMISHNYKQAAKQGGFMKG